MELISYWILLLRHYLSLFKAFRVTQALLSTEPGMEAFVSQHSESTPNKGSCSRILALMWKIWWTEQKRVCRSKPRTKETRCPGVRKGPAS